MVIINVASPQQGEALKAAGGGTRALGWILDGLSSPRATDVGLTRSILLQQLAGQGIPAELASQMADVAERAGQFNGQQTDDIDALPVDARAEGEREAVEVALALDSGRTGTKNLIASTTPESARGRLYRDEYAKALQAAGLEDVELVDRFPIMTGTFAYTRGDSGPGGAKLIPFRSRAGKYTVYSDIANTEALFFRLRPSVVAAWLRANGAEIAASATERGGRLAILRVATIPVAGSETDPPTAGSELVTLIHSFAHRFIRRTAMYAGIDRNGLAEFLVPLHLGFFVYATNRGDFVMGGLQAVFEDELHELLRDFVTAEHRCALDPGCTHAGAACAACLHLGEPSCRFYNGYLDRRALSGATGYLTVVRQLIQGEQQPVLAPAGARGVRGT